jgi:hypothetical protein
VPGTPDVAAGTATSVCQRRKHADASEQRDRRDKCNDPSLHPVHVSSFRTTYRDEELPSHDDVE